MTLARRLGLPLLSAALLLPASATVAQDVLVGGPWVGSDDGSFLVMASDPNVTPGVVRLEADQVPASLDGQSLPDDLFAVTSDPADAKGFHVVRVFGRSSSTSTSRASRLRPIPRAPRSWRLATWRIRVPWWHWRAGPVSRPP